MAALEWRVVKTNPLVNGLWMRRMAVCIYDAAAPTAEVGLIWREVAGWCWIWWALVLALAAASHYGDGGAGRMAG